MTPPLAKDVDVSTFCDPDTGVIISTRKNSDVYAYNYDLLVFEERFNEVIIQGGIAGLLYAR